VQKLSEAKDFLAEQLAEGSVEVVVILERAEEAGISKATLRRAKGALGVRSYTSGVGAPWMWRLPERAETSATEIAVRGEDPAYEVGDPSGATLGREIRQVYDDPSTLWRALLASRGLLGPASEELGVSREALELVAEEDPNVAELIRRATERALDTTIGRLWEVADTGHVPALGRLLAARAAHRGFGTTGGKRAAERMVPVKLRVHVPWREELGSVTFEMPESEAEELPDETLISVHGESSGQTTELTENPDDPIGEHLDERLSEFLDRDA
jgi:hypothetical protein